MARLSHSNLVGIYDFGEISDMLYLVMEFVEGSDLHESKGDSAIDAEVAVTLIRSVASGLAESHRMGLVHRDIKPANILINTDLVPKLGDFGLAIEVEVVRIGFAEQLGGQVVFGHHVPARIGANKSPTANPPKNPPNHATSNITHPLSWLWQHVA